MRKPVIINCGVDLDGVCANFAKKFSQLCNEMYGDRCYIIEDNTLLKHWNWWNWYPIKEVEVNRVWEKIIETKNFWTSLEVLNKGQWDYFIDTIGKSNRINVYFITSIEETTGMSATKQSATWLESNGWKQPFVIKTKTKEKFIKDLNIEFFIDDKAENLIDIKNHNPDCKIYAQDVPHNKLLLDSSKLEYKRAFGLRQFADDVLAKLYDMEYKNVYGK